MLSASPEAATIVGNSVSLTCNTLVVNHLVVPPTIEWLTPSGDQQDNTSVPKTTGSGVYQVYLSRLTFASVQPSLGGEYSCNVTINIPELDVHTISTIILTVMRKFLWSNAWSR